MNAKMTGSDRSRETTLAMNEALVLGSLRQHELAAAAHDLNDRLQRAITAHELTARELLERARLLDLSSDAMMVVNLEGKISLWNKGAETLYGWKREEVLGRPIHSLLQTEFPQPMAEIMAQLDYEGQFSGEIAQIARDGQRLSLLCRWVLDRGSDCILISHIDISARKIAEVAMTQMRDRAVAASKAKDEFMAALSHELRTPLTPVLLLAGDAANDTALPKSSRKLFATIVKNVKLEARLIDDLLDLTRITHGKIALDLQSLDAHAVLEDAIEMVRSELDEKQLLLTLRLRAPNPMIMGDSIRLQQIFWNVLRNAVKFTPPGGKIAIETEIEANGILRIKVVDTGMGISEVELARLFTPFSQGDHAADGGSHRFGGLGLGLSISRRLTELHSGTIRVTSGGLNRGATFAIELPLDQAMRKVEVRPPSSVGSSNGSTGPLPAPQLRSLRILLVEDHEATRSALTHLLVRRRHQVVSVGSLAEAQGAAKGAEFDLMISDLGLPDGDGHDLMRDLSARRRLRGIALSGYGDEQSIEHSRQAGFAVHLTKPVSIQALENALGVAAAAEVHA